MEKDKLIEKLKELVGKQDDFIRYLKTKPRKDDIAITSYDTIINGMNREISALDKERESGKGIKHGIPFECPECGKEIQYGLSEQGQKLFATSRLFSKEIPAGAEEILMQTDCDCMVCSFAMLMGYSYDFAKTFFPERAITKTGYRWEWLVDYLKANGIHLTWRPSKNEVDWSRPAMLDVPSLTAPDKGDHIIFWSGSNIIDPSRKELRYTEIPEQINCAYQVNEKWTKAPKEESIKVKEVLQSTKDFSPGTASYLQK